MILLALAASVAQFDLACIATAKSATENGKPVVTSITPRDNQRFSIDLTTKLYRAVPDGSVRHLGVDQTTIRLGEINVDRRSGHASYVGEMGPMTFIREWDCTKKAFTSLPAKKF